MNYRALATSVRAADLEPIARDPDDDHVLACAIGAGAAVIVTRDRNLLKLEPFRGVRILPAHEALAAFPPATSS